MIEKISMPVYFALLTENYATYAIALLDGGGHECCYASDL